MKKENITSKKKENKIKILLIAISLLVLLRVYLPYAILHFANKKLATLDGYYGHINDIDVALFRGAYVINNIYINKKDGIKKEPIEFFISPKIDLSVEWREIFKGRIVGEVEFEKPVLKYTLGETIGKKASKDPDFIQLIKDFMLLRINRFVANGGEVHYMDMGSSPKVDLFISNIYLQGRGLTNKPEQNVVLPALITMNGNLYDGNLKIEVKLDPLNKIPTFDLNAELTQTNLTYLNDFFKAYGNFDLINGNMAIYTEFAAKNNQFRGYLKPLIRDLDIVQFNISEGNLKQITWEAFVGSAAEIFQNQPKDQLASKIPIEGKFTKPNVAIFDAIVAILKNAFVKALEPSIENSINISNVLEEDKKKGFFKKTFIGKKDEK